MDDLRVTQKTKNPIKWYLFYNYIKKRKWWIISIILASILIIFPEQSGNAIGDWASSFYENIIKNF